MTEKKRLSKREERRRQQYNDPHFYDGVDAYNYGDDDSLDDGNSDGYDGRAVAAPRKSQLDRVRALEANFTSLPKSGSTTLKARISDLEEVIKKPDRTEGVPTNDRITWLEEAYSGKSQSKSSSDVDKKLAAIEKQLEITAVLPQMADRLSVAEKAAGYVPERRHARMGIPDRVERLYHEVIGDDDE